MPGVVLSPKPAKVNITGASLLAYAEQYHQASVVWLPHAKRMSRFDAVSFHLVCQALELYLKSFIWLKQGIGLGTLKSRYGHDLAKLWKASKREGISGFAKPTPLRDDVVALVAPYYKQRRFNYLDFTMIVSGYSDLRAEPRAVPTLMRLNRQLDKTIRGPLFRAS